MEANAPEVPDPDNKGYEYSLNSYFTHTRLARPALIAFSIQKALLSEGASNQDKEILKWFKSLIIRSEERMPLSNYPPNFDVPLQKHKGGSKYCYKSRTSFDQAEAKTQST